MGTLSNLLEFQPFSMVPPGALPENSPQTIQEFRPIATGYANPVHFTQFPPFGPFTPAAIDRLSSQEYLAPRPACFANNAQIVSVPERPVDKGTFQAIVRDNNLQYNQPNSGVYLQSMQQYQSQAYAGTAPVTGIYTGLDNGNSYKGYQNGYELP